MDADLFVRYAIDWKNVPKKCIAIRKSVQNSLYPIKMGFGYGKKIDITFEYRNDNGYNNPDDNCNDGNMLIHYVEHVEVDVRIDYTMRGALSMYLTSPLSNFNF